MMQTLTIDKAGLSDLRRNWPQRQVLQEFRRKRNRGYKQGAAAQSAEKISSIH